MVPFLVLEGCLPQPTRYYNFFVAGKITILVITAKNRLTGNRYQQNLLQCFVWFLILKIFFLLKDGEASPNQPVTVLAKNYHNFNGHFCTMRPTGKSVDFNVLNPAALCSDSSVDESLGCPLEMNYREIYYHS